MSNDPKIDGTAFEIPKFGAADVYCAVVVALPLLALQVLLWVPFILLALPALAIFRLYLGTLPRPLRRIEAPRCRAFGVVKITTLLLSLPALVTLWAWVLLVWAWSVLSSLPFGLVVSGLLRGKWSVLGNNIVLAFQYCEWPAWNWGDICRGVIGSMDRQGFSEFVFGSILWGIGSLLLVPVFKYAMQCNLFLDELELKFANEWSEPPRPDLSAEYLETFTTTFVCTSLHSRAQRDFIDRQNTFAPHYPYPSPGRQAATGMQFSEKNKGIFLTKVIHNPDLEELSEAACSIKLEDVLRCVFRVQLLYTNPFHPLVGEVFVNVTRDRRVEHQMHCVASKSTYLGNRVYEAAHQLFATTFLRGSMEYLIQFGLDP